MPDIATAQAQIKIAQDALTKAVAALAATTTTPATPVVTTPTAPAAVLKPVAKVSGTSATLTWTATTGPYTVSRDGFDSENKGSWSGVGTSPFTFTLLKPSTTYTLTVKDSKGVTESVKVSLPSTAATPTPTSGGVSGKGLFLGADKMVHVGAPSGPRIGLVGPAFWGIYSPDGGGFAQQQMAQLASNVAGMKRERFNFVRAGTCVGAGQGDQVAKAIQVLNAAASQGLYVGYCDWSWLDVWKGDSFVDHAAEVGDFLARIWAAAKGTPYSEFVFFENVNEPQNVGDDRWRQAQDVIRGKLRAAGYPYVNFMDTPGWSHNFPQAQMAQLHDSDPAKPEGVSQTGFCSHNYANEGWDNGGNSFNGGTWQERTGGEGRWWSLYESEQGNYNGDASTVHLSWSQQAAAYFGQQVRDGKLAAYSPFLWGPWYDANGLCNDHSGNSLTEWGKAAAAAARTVNP